ncbi:protoporphyrinogen oxidase [Microbacterium rhizomatis]|uniref:Coproporphyrinogen III oxidase n=1 Tax=Microbacterium rhizomatis TaxID=1631477 RepID=A0A5J5J1D4_9MICO|nr:protoporphyrinogen oxidase [Microbacterium rhizomatis]KAA9108285.1 protoporphyrinogen oxidase [Microbacterium rhizomatis]
MSDEADPGFDELVEQARDTRVVVIGGGIAGLVAALECAKVGLRVTVLEASDRVGGVIRSAEVAGVTVDVGAESYATRGGRVRALLTELGLDDAVVRPAAGRAWVAGLPGGAAAPLPAGGVLGIPDNPWSPDVRRIIGWGGAWRAYVDRLRPPLTIGHEHSLGRLVRTRMGRRVLERLVAPVTGGVYSARPDDIDVDVAAPGLNSALTRAGSLAGAVGLLVGERSATPGSAVEGIDGGMTRLPAALRSRLVELGAVVRTSVRAESVTAADPATGTGWTVSVVDLLDDSAGPLEADAVIVATPEDDARRLLAPVAPALEPFAAAPHPIVEIVTLALEAPALDEAPRGTGVLTVPGARAAKALTHSTAKWAWLAREAQGLHLVRVSFGAQGEAPATATLDDTDAVQLALAEASALLGVPLDPAQLRGAQREAYVQSQPASAIGQADRSAAARSAVRAIDGLAVVGAWISGTGLAQVVPDAVAEAEHVRRRVLWGDRAADH